MANVINKKFFDFDLLKRVLRFAAPYKKRFYWSIALAIILAVFTPVRPILIQITVDRYISGGLWKWVLIITIIQIGFLLLETGLRFYFSYITAWLGQNVVKDLRVKVYKKVLSLNLSQFDKTPIGTLTTRTVDDIERINDVFADGFIPIVADLLSIICVLSYMFWADWRLTLIALIPFPVLLIATYYFKESVNKSFHRVRNAVAHLNAFVQEHITGMSVVQAFAAEEREMEKFKNINKEHRNANIHAIWAYSIFFPIVEIVLATSIGLLVWWTSHKALNLQESQQGTLMAFILCLNLIFRPLRVIADKFNVLQMGMVASERVFKVLDNDDFADDRGIFQTSRLKGDIKFKGVSFGYNEEREVLKNIDFHIEPGQTMAIVGHTGSGKTSIISLINRLYHVKKGEILVDDRNI